MEGFVMALYNYTARKDTELSFRKGEVLVLLRPPDDSGWWYGRHAVKQPQKEGGAGEADEGLFPHNYVRRLEPENYVARFAFKGKGDDDAYLPFGQGERLEVVLKDPNGWWIARKAGAHAVGLVPANYIVPASPGGAQTNAPQPGGRDEDGQKQQAPSSSSSPSSPTTAAEQVVVHKEGHTQTGTSEGDGKSTSGDGTASLNGQEAAKEPTTTTPSSTDRNEKEEGKAETSRGHLEGGSSGGEVSARLDEAIAQLRSLCARPGTERVNGQRKRDSGQEGPAAGDSSDDVPLCLGDDHKDFITFLRDQLQQREDLAARLSAMSAASTMTKS